MKLSRERKNFEEMFMHAPAPYITINKTGNIVQINNAAAELLGLPTYKYKFTSIFPYLENTSKIEFTNYFHKIFAGEKPENRYFVFKGLDGGKIYSKVQTNLYFDTEINDWLCRLTIADVSAEHMLVQKTEQTFKDLFDAVIDSVIIVDFDANVLLMNQTAINRFQYKAHEIKQLKVPDFEANENISDVLNRIKVLQEKGEITFESAHKTKYGLVFPVEVHAKIIEFEEKKVIISICRDITKRKEREVEFQKLNIAVNQSPVSIIITDPKGRIEYVNPKFTDLTGYSAEEVMGKNPRIWKSDRTPKETIKTLWDTILNKEIWKGEIQNKRKNGNLFWESAVIGPVLDKKGEIVSFVALKEDITEYKKIRTALTESEEKFRLLYNSISDAVFIVSFDRNADGGLIEVNKAATRMYGYSRTELLQMTLPELLQNNYKAINKTKKAFFEGISEFFEARHFTKTGIEILVDIRSSIIELENEKVLIWVVRDITERKKAEREVYEREEQFRTIFMNSPQPKALTKVDTGEIVEVNEMFVKKIGLTRNELIGKNTLELGFFTKEKREKFYKELLIDGKVEAFEVEYVNPNGDYYVALIFASFMFIKNTQYILTVFVDITEKKQLESKLMYSAGVIKAAMESSTESFFLFDRNYNILEFNRNARIYARKFWGADVKRGEPLKQFAAAANAWQEFVEYFNRALNGEVCKDERLIELGKHKIWFYTVFSPVYNDHNKIVAVAFNSSDITERKIAEIRQAELNTELAAVNEELNAINDYIQKVNQTLEIERNQFIMLLNSIPENVYVASKDTFEIVFANTHLKNALKRDIVGEKCFSAICGLHEPCKICSGSSIFKDDKPFYWENFNTLLGKEYYHIDKAIKWTDGTDARFQLSIDISKLKEAETKLLQQNKLITEINHNITDSINYASRIQTAVLGSVGTIISVFEKAFVFLKPHSIVSGDFYMFRQKEHYKIAIAADCTGHGVSGAFMTLLGHRFLEEIIDNTNVVLPDKILYELNRKITGRLNSSADELQINDGMDIAILTIDTKNYKVYYSGARNPVCMVNKGNLTFIKASRFSIGGQFESKEFELHSFELIPGTMFYLFSDGFRDQFGGPMHKKFSTEKFKVLLSEVANYPIESQKEMLEAQLDTWRGGNDLTDDVLVVGIQM